MDETILRTCQARIFRDIWRVTDPDTALKMFLTMEKNVVADNDTPDLNRVTEPLRRGFLINCPLISGVSKLSKRNRNCKLLPIDFLPKLAYNDHAGSDCSAVYLRNRMKV